MATDRYDRQTLLPEVGLEGQRRLADAKVAVVGIGALGCVSSELLARAGVGSLRLIDRDLVELNNLQRQVLFAEEDVDRPKAAAAESRLLAVNSEIDIAGVAKDLNFHNIDSVLDGVDLILDGLDNMETRYLVNDYAVREGLPFLYGGAIATQGMAMTIVPDDTACLRCLVPVMPRRGSLPTCDTAGVLASVTTAVASIQTTEALRLITGHGPTRGLLVYDGWDHSLERFTVPRREDCITCVQGDYEFLDAKVGQVITSLCGQETISLDPLESGGVSLDEVAARLERVGDVRRGNGVIVFTVGDHQLTLFPDGRALIRGTEDEAIARSLYSKYIG